MRALHQLIMAILTGLLLCSQGICAGQDPVAVIPFTLQDGQILLPVRLNDSPRTFNLLFDSGANGMAIRKTLADSLGLGNFREQSTSVVGGNMNISVSQDNTVRLGDLTLPQGQNIALFDQLGKVDGIIGINLARYFVLRFDFDYRQLTLYPFEDYVFDAQGETLDINLDGGLMHIGGALDLTGKGFIEGHFVIDTGANYNLICFYPFVRTNRLLVSGFKPTSTTSTMSMGVATPIFLGEANAFRMAHLTISDMPVTLQGQARETGWTPDADGSIGIKLMSRYNFTINLMDKQIHLAPRK